MSDELNRKLRDNQGRRRWPDLRRLLEVILDREFSERDRLGVEETETLKRLFYDRLRSGAGVSRRVVRREAVVELWSEVGRLAEALPDLECVLLHQHDEYTGAVRVPAAAVLRSPARVWGAVGDDLRLTTDDAVDGFCFEFNHVHPADEYELSTWGRFTAR
jgi:hypothetical protein